MTKDFIIRKLENLDFIVQDTNSSPTIYFDTDIPELAEGKNTILMIKTPIQILYVGDHLFICSNNSTFKYETLIIKIANWTSNYSIVELQPL